MNFAREDWACLFLLAANAAISLWVDALSALGSKFPRGNVCAQWVVFVVHLGSGHMNFAGEDWTCLFL
jgi:hypothetical protein